jgi:hypothetical protein
VIVETVHAGAVGVARSACNPFVLLQVDEAVGKDTLHQARAVLTAEQARRLVNDLKKAIEDVTRYPEGLRHPEYRSRRIKP